MLRRSLAAAGAAIACGAFAVPAARVGAAPASACNAKSGVTVIVDFTHFRGDIERGCDPGEPATALAAMRTAGFTTAGTTRYGDAFVCRIDGLPTPKSEACTATPPAKSSWAFYYARPSDRAWTYSAAGVLSYEPKPGTLIAFAFGNYAKPGVLPSGASATTTTTTTAPALPRRPTVAPTSPPVTVPVSPAATTAPVVVTTPVTTTAPVPSTSATRARGTTTPSTTNADASTTTGPRIVDKTASGPVPDDDSGSALPALVTIALVASLGAGAFATIRARRRRAA